MWNLGVTKIMSTASGHQLNATGPQWLRILFLIMSTTMHLADFRDQRGDQEIGRRTLPLVWGDTLARYVTSLTVMGVSRDLEPFCFLSFEGIDKLTFNVFFQWTLFCCIYWSTRWSGFLITTTIGMIISCRLLLYRHKSADHLTWYAKLSYQNFKK